MLQVWRINVPAGPNRPSPAQGWAVAHTAIEAKELSGIDSSIITQEPERMWIANQKIIWEHSKP